MSPQVSVIIPVRNRPMLVARAIQSVLAQTHTSCEIIVVDDASVDETPAVVREFARQWPEHIRLIVQPAHRGAQAARNTGGRAASCEWIAFLDSDDEYLPDSISVRLDAAHRQHVDVVHSECYIVRYPDPERVHFRIPPLAGQVHAQLLERPGPVFPAMLLKKKALEAIGWLDERIVSYQEWDTAIRLAKSFALGFVPEPTFIYDCHSGETISKNRLGEAQGYEQIVVKHRDEILGHRGTAVLSRHFDEIARLYFLAGREDLARQSRRMAVRCQPLPQRSRTHLRSLGRRLRRVLVR